MRQVPRVSILLRISCCAARGAGSHGFSLLEVLLALALSTALLAGLFSGLTMFMRSFDSGRTRVEEAQLARALLRQLARDLRAAVVDPASGSTTTDSSLARPSDFSATTGDRPDAANREVGFIEFFTGRRPAATEASTAPAASSDGAVDLPATTSASPFVFRGTSDSLELCVRAPDQEAALGTWTSSSPTSNARQPSAYATDSPSNAVPPGDLRQVAYGLLGATSADEATEPSPSILPSNSTAARWSEVHANAKGLLRRELPGTGETSVDESASESAVALAESDIPPTIERDATYSLDEQLIAETITPEVAAVAFRYFDGSAWYESWDSQADGGLPVAVDIALWLVPPEEESRRPRKAERTSTPDSRADATEDRSAAASESFHADAAGYAESPELVPDYRLVVYLPTARPRAAESSSTLPGDEESETSGAASSPMSTPSAPMYDTYDDRPSTVPAARGELGGQP